MGPALEDLGEGESNGPDADKNNQCKGVDFKYPFLSACLSSEFNNCGYVLSLREIEIDAASSITRYGVESRRV
jgi:hypothetical protein